MVGMRQFCEKNTRDALLFFIRKYAQDSKPGNSLSRQVKKAMQTWVTLKKGISVCSPSTLQHMNLWKPVGIKCEAGRKRDEGERERVVSDLKALSFFL